MRILANENFPGEAVKVLRERGHDVTWIRTDAPGMSDRDVLKRAQREDRIIVTFDKDFGELAYRFRLTSSCGVILFRISAPSPTEMTNRIIAGLESRTDWTGKFSVVEEKRIRMTPLPATKE